jgi:hypothetical protein
MCSAEEKAEIGRQNKEAGDRMEMKIVNILKRQKALWVMRSSGSKGLFDVVAQFPHKQRQIVAKVNGYLEPKERKELSKYMVSKPDYVQVEIWWYKSPKKMSKKIVNEHWECWVPKYERR